MSKKHVLTQEEINEIINLYSSNEIRDKRILAKKYNISEDRLIKLFKLHNVPIKKVIKLSYSESIKRFNLDLKENHEFIAICKKTGKEFKDYCNFTGILSKHIAKIYPNVVQLDPRPRLTYLSRYNKFWHQEYFDIIQREIIIKPIKPKIDIEVRDREIVNLYNPGENVRLIANKLNISVDVVRRVLKKKNVKITPIKKKVLSRRNLRKQKFIIPEPSDVNKIIIAKCIKTNKSINVGVDNFNLNKHLREVYSGSVVPNYYNTKRYEYENNKSWYEQYFNFIQVDKQPMRKCQYCEWEMRIDKNNKTTYFKTHLKNEHNISLEEHLKNYPEDAKYNETFVSVQKKKSLLNDYNSVKCEICGERFRHISPHHLKMHKISLTDYKLKYNAETYSIEYKEFLGKQIINLLSNHTIKKSSKGEDSVYNFLKEYDLNIEIGNRKLLNGKEVDILINDFKLGIEYNGCKFHTEWYAKKNPNYHLDKTISLNEKGYRLIHLFEDEWEMKKDIVINKLKHIFNISDSTKLHARKCFIKTINKKVADSFLEKYHIQGTDKNKIQYGAFYNNILVGVMTFNKTLKNEYILNRFAVNYEYNVRGLASKMLNHFIIMFNPSKIISFADRRWTFDPENNLYTKLGFTLKNIIEPTYTYYKASIHKFIRFDKKVFNRKKLLEKYSDQINNTMTEIEMLKTLGIDRIWDCGQFKYELTIANS